MQYRLRTLLTLLAVFASFAVLPMVGAGLAFLGKRVSEAIESEIGAALDRRHNRRDNLPKPNPEVVRAPVSPN